jgi:NAD(P)-dependent dehydrogenase (short-subunit alcohol dehydrogenase family)
MSASATRSFLGFGGRAVVVTGASSGIGRACALELASQGARVVMVGREQATLAQTAAVLEGDGHHTLIIDLDEIGSIAPAVRRAVETVGPLYGLCHAAGVVATKPLSVTTPESLRALFNINLMAALELARVVSRRDVMIAEGGSLVFVSSVYANRGVAGETAYSATKGALASAARSMAVELARRRVRVNSIAPGLVKTPMTDAALEELSPGQIEAIERRHLLGIGTPADVAKAAVFLLSPEARWITGVDLTVDGGYSAQ